jgi:hypothetical protein
MRDIHSTLALRSALQYMMSSDMPSEHKAVIIDLLTSALRDQDTRRLEAKASAKVDGPWQEAETAALQSFLSGKTATSWQHADELLMHLASSLGRDPQYVRSKATDLGFGEGVDYRLAKVRATERARLQD